MAAARVRALRGPLSGLRTLALALGGGWCAVLALVAVARLDEDSMLTAPDVLFAVVAAAPGLALIAYAFAPVALLGSEGIRIGWSHFVAWSDISQVTVRTVDAATLGVLPHSRRRVCPVLHLHTYPREVVLDRFGCRVSETGRARLAHYVAVLAEAAHVPVPVVPTLTELRAAEVACSGGRRTSVARRRSDR